MKSLFILFFCFLTLDSYSQNLSREEFETTFLKTLNQKFNITGLSDSFSNCAYSQYQMSDEKGDGFKIGYEVAMKCLPNHISGIQFSDGGDKFYMAIMSDFKTTCVINNKAYENDIDLEGYCTCLINQFEENEIGVKRLLSSEFGTSESYRRIMAKCINEN